MCAPAADVTAADHKIRAAFAQRRDQLGNLLGRVAQVRVHHDQVLAARRAQPFQHGKTQIAIARAHDEPQRILARQLTRELLGAVAAIVIDNDQLIGRVQRCHRRRGAQHQRSQIPRLAIGGHDDADVKGLIGHDEVKK